MLDSVVIISFNEGCLAPQLPLQQSPSIFSLSHFRKKIISQIEIKKIFQAAPLSAISIHLLYFTFSQKIISLSLFYIFTKNISLSLFHIFTKKYITISLSHFHKKISYCLSKIASLALTSVSCSVTDSLTLSPFIVHCVSTRDWLC